MIQDDSIIESGDKPVRAPWPRKSARLNVDAKIVLRRAGHSKYLAGVYDVSPEGCKIEFVERPQLDELVWVKFDGIEALEAYVCWIVGSSAGLQFRRPIHPAVFKMLFQNG